MELERWHRVDNILQTALALNPAERSTFIDSACEGDESLRDEVISLLSLEQEALDIVDMPALEAAAPLFASDQFDLIEGQFVDHFRILSLLGIGGMGEVYLAEDTRLGRRIALKLLPADFTKDHDRVRRFQQEARAASALNHPYIVTIHETGEFEDRHFIATEFIEGETLRQRMRHKTLNLSATLDIAIQVAEALGVAHKAGIVHRDIKPENIMLRPDGYVKLLDFGLAKLPQQSADADSSKLYSNETDTSPGLLIGTVKYMSPEQSRGLNLDARSDIFSMGVVIYEMIAGRPPFEGETNSDVIAALLKEDPKPLSQFVPELPVEVDHVVCMALAKNQAERYQSITDLLADLKNLRHATAPGLDLSAHPDSSSKPMLEPGPARVAILGIGEQPAEHVAPYSGEVVRRIRPYRIRAVAAGILLLLAVAAVAYVYEFRSSTQSTESFHISQVRKFTNTGKARDAAISPDGNYVAYVVDDAGQQSLWVRLKDSGAATLVVPPTGVRYAALSFSPDSQSIYFVKYERQPAADENALHRVRVFGGDLTRVVGNVHSTISFSPNGNQFAFFRRYKDGKANKLFIANTDGTGEEELAGRTIPDRLCDYPAGPAWSPDGQVIVCGVTDKEHTEASLIAVRIHDRSENRIVSNLPKALNGVAWVPDQSALIVLVNEYSQSPGTKILYVSYPGGELRSIRQDPGQQYGLSMTADTKAIVTGVNQGGTNVWLGSAEDMSQIRQITFGTGNHPGLSFTPDGRIVYAELSDGPANLWVMERDGTGKKQLTFTPEGAFMPSVSADGKYIVFVNKTRLNRARLARIDIDGSNLKQLTEEVFELDLGAPQCSPNSRWVIYLEIYQGGASIWKVSIEGDIPVQLTDRAKDVAWPPAISPDGKLVAYYSDQRAIEVIPFEGGQPIARFPITQSDSEGGLQWVPDGSGILHLVHSGGATNIWKQLLKGGHPKQLTNFKSELILGFVWSQDGKQFAMARGQLNHDILLIETSK